MRQVSPGLKTSTERCLPTHLALCKARQFDQTIHGRDEDSRDAGAFYETDPIWKFLAEQLSHCDRSRERVNPHNHRTITDLQARDLGADFANDTGSFVAEFRSATLGDDLHANEDILDDGTLAWSNRHSCDTYSEVQSTRKYFHFNLIVLWSSQGLRGPAQCFQAPWMSLSYNGLL